MVHERRVCLDLPRKNPIEIKVTQVEGVIILKKVVGRKIDGDEEFEVFSDLNQDEMMLVFSRIIESI